MQRLQRIESRRQLLQGLLLSAYLKMLLADPSDDQLRQQVGAVYERYSHFMDADLQQRAVEYQGLLKHPEVANRNVTAMPKWEKRKSLLLRRMAEKEVLVLLPCAWHNFCTACNQPAWPKVVVCAVVPGQTLVL